MIKNLAGRLKELRIQNKLTQKQVSELLGISPSIISGYETGERTPSAEFFFLYRICINAAQTTYLGKVMICPQFY